jgi:hypothetical protein
MPSIEAWAGEESYCAATQALRFDAPLRHQLIGPSSTKKERPSCIFRRLFSSNGPLTRLEIGLRVGPPYERRWLLDASGCLALIRSCLELRVRVPSAPTSHGSLELLMADKIIVSHYLRCTTKRGSGSTLATQEWWIAPGDPLMLIEYRSSDLAALPRKAKLVRTLDFAHITISHLGVEHRSRRLGIWFLRTAENTDRDVLRRLRLHLFRLHSEIECLKQVFRAITRRQLVVSNGSNSDDLQWYLRSATRLLSRGESHGFRQLPILKAAMDAQYSVEPGDRETLLTEDRIRPNILRQIKTLTEQSTQSRSQTINIDLKGGTLTMEERNISVSGEGNILNVAEYISGVTNIVQQNVNKSGASGEVKEMVKQLMDRVQQLSSPW